MLYLIESSGYYKIGYAKDISKRMKAYATHNPGYVLIDFMEGSRGDELFLHNLCKRFRYRLEWFYEGAFTIWESYKEGSRDVLGSLYKEMLFLSKFNNNLFILDEELINLLTLRVGSFDYVHLLDNLVSLGRLQKVDINRYRLLL